MNRETVITYIIVLWIGLPFAFVISWFTYPLWFPQISRGTLVQATEYFLAILTVNSILAIALSKSKKKRFNLNG